MRGRKKFSDPATKVHHSGPPGTVLVAFGHYVSGFSGTASVVLGRCTSVLGRLLGALPQRIRWSWARGMDGLPSTSALRLLSRSGFVRSRGLATGGNDNAYAPGSRLGGNGPLLGCRLRADGDEGSFIPVSRTAVTGRGLTVSPPRRM